MELIPKGQPTESRSINVQTLLSTDFPVLNYRLKDLIEYAKIMLETSQFCKINFPGKIVRKMVTLIASNYQHVAYHNFSHAFSLALVQIS